MAVSSCAKDTSATYAITEDTSACAPIVDRSARKVTVYARLVYTGATNAVINVRGCAPSTSEPGYPLQKSYDSCTHKVDLSTKLAQARYKDYYIDKLGTRSEVSDCTVDTEKQWPITEREGTCKVFVDYTKDDEKVFKQSTMHYRDDAGIEHEARGCDQSTLTEPVKMVKDTNLCSIRHDFDNNQSHQMFLWKYTLDGVAYQASACADTETVYPHEKYTIDASGSKVCNVQIDQTKKLVTLYYRVGIVVNGNVQYITECKPDSSNTLKVVATTDGCTDPASWQHDLAGGVSYDNERWYYTLNGTREYVTPCQTGSKTYTHDVTTVGWQLHDDKLYGFTMSKVTIDAPIGAYVVSLNTVLPGAVQQPYVLRETKDVIPNDSSGTPSSYEGCTGLFTTAKTEFYTRPDSTEYPKVVGTGEAVSEDVCQEKSGGTKNVHIGYTFQELGRQSFNCIREVNSRDTERYTKTNIYNGSYDLYNLYEKVHRVNAYTGDIVSMYFKSHNTFSARNPRYTVSMPGSGAVAHRCSAIGVYTGVASSTKTPDSVYTSIGLHAPYRSGWSLKIDPKLKFDGRHYRFLQDSQVKW